MIKQEIGISDCTVGAGIPIESKPLLTLKEASRYTGIGINKLRDMSNERNCDYVLFVGRKRMFKREALLKFIDESYSV